MYDVFISYSRKDTPVIDRIEEEFKKYGITMFIDRAGIDAGTDWAQTIAQALYDSEVVLFVWSENSNTSENTANEIALAIEYQKTIVPFKIGEFKADFKLSYRLIRFNRIDALPYNEGKVVELGQKMAKLLGKNKVETAPTAAQAPIAPAEPIVPKDDKRLELKYKTGKDALLGFQLEEAVKDLAEPAIKNYKDARLLLSYIVTKGPRILHLSKEVFKPFYDAAEQQNGYALFVIACVALYIEVDHDTTYGYGRLSADTGDDYGLYWLSECYDRGFGVKKDNREGENYRQQAIDKGNVPALLLHARNLQFGWTIKKNPKKGFSILQMLAEKEIPEAVYRLAYSYETGTGIQKDEKKAEELYYKAIELGYMEGYDSIAALHTFEGGRLTEDENEKKAAYELLMKGTKYNETSCISSLANGYYYGTFVKQDYTQAMRWYKKAAQYGDGFAYYMISYMNYYGNGVDENNEEAWKWAKQGAERGIANCIYFKGVICKDGYAPQDHQKSDCIRFFEEAADLGGYAGEQSLLELYEIYRPNWYRMYQLKEYTEYDWVEKNEEKALAAIRRAAEYDNTDAQYLYAVILTDTDREDSDEFTGVDMLEQVAPSQPLAYLRLAMLSLDGIGRPFSQDYAVEMCNKATEAEVDKALISYVLGMISVQMHDDVKPNAENKSEFDEILNTFKPCIDKRMIEAYDPYVETLFSLICASDIDTTADTSAPAATGKEGVHADTSVPDMIFIFKSWSNTPAATAPERNIVSGSAYNDMLFDVVSAYSSELGWPQAMFDFGVCCKYGLGTSEDEDKAIQYYKQAAERGIPKAALNLGKIYFDHNDKKEAKYWFRKALELGYDQEEVSELLEQC